MQPNDQTNVEYRQDDRQRSIDQRAVDEHINVPQPERSLANPKESGIKSRRMG